MDASWGVEGSWIAKSRSCYDGVRRKRLARVGDEVKRIGNSGPGDEES